MIIKNNDDDKKNSPESKSYSDQDQERLPLGPAKPHEFAHHEFQRLVKLPLCRSKLSVPSFEEDKKEIVHSSSIISAWEPVFLGGICVS